MMKLSTRNAVWWSLPLMLVAGACSKDCSSGSEAAAAEAASKRQPLEPIEFGPKKLQLASAKQPRLLLDKHALSSLKKSASKKTRAWRRVSAQCDARITSDEPSGYQGHTWADSVLALALCWHASGDERYAKGAIRYLEALLDDRYKLGDGEGGAGVVRHDSGYGVRFFGVGAALGYDWLRNAPGMTPALKKRVVERLDAWLGWYEKKGYLNDEPFANYFWGYLSALSFSGLALADDGVPEANAWLDKSRKLLSRRVLPAFQRDLRGGGWPEGWQYGELVAAEVALVAEAYETAANVPLAKKLPWLESVVTHHTQALLPGGDSVYAGGTWAEHPAKPNAIGLAGISIALEGIDEESAARARWLVTKELPELTREHAWLALLADRPGGKRIDPRKGQKKSAHLDGQGLSLMRSSWSDSAVFASFQAGPRLAPDHQHKDEGHFELWRGGDPLLVDAGDSEGDATINHNTLLIDDGGRVMTYPPNQGVWGYGVDTTRFGDDGRVVVAVGEIADAYLPACVRSGCNDRAVDRATRSFVFVRPSLVVTNDRVSLEDEDDSVVWAAHTLRPPKVKGTRTTAISGGSRVDIDTLLPRGAKPRVRREPTPSGEGVHRKNSVRGTTYRIEVASPKGEEDRHLLHWMVASAEKKPAKRANFVGGNGLSGAHGRLGKRWIAVLFADTADAGEVSLPPNVDEIVVAGLSPNKHYSVGKSSKGRCTVKIAPAKQGKRPGSGGFLRFAGCRSK